MRAKWIKNFTFFSYSIINAVWANYFISLHTAKIGIFYTIFYGVLAALVAVCMWVFLQTLDPRIPKWQLHESLIGTNPGNFFLFLHDMPIIYNECQFCLFTYKVWDSVHCLQKIMLKVHWSGIEELTRKISQCGQMLWMTSWFVSINIFCGIVSL